MRRRGFIIGMGALAFLPKVAFAHGPTRQKVTEMVEVNASADEVWALIGNFQDMNWHPYIYSTHGEGGNEIDATRFLTLSGEDGGPTDAVIAEILYKYSAEEMTYSYRITDVSVDVLPVTNYSAHLTVIPIDDGKCNVEWRGAFYRGFPNNDPPEELNDEAAVEAVTAVYRVGLEQIVARFAES